MLPWWGWALLWLLLVVGGALWLFVLSRRVWRSATVLADALARATVPAGRTDAARGTRRLTGEPDLS